MSFPMTSTAPQSQAVTPATKVFSSNAQQLTVRLATKLPSATALDPLVLYSSDEDSERENNCPKDSRKQSPIQTSVAESTTVAKQPKALVVTAEKQQSRGIRVVSLLDDSDSDDDELLKRSVFDKNYRFKKKALSTTIKAEETKVTPNRPSNQTSLSQNNKRICGNDRKVVRPDLTASAKLTPKEAKRNAKREIREIDTTATMSDSEIEKQKRDSTKPGDNQAHTLMLGTNNIFDKKAAPRDSSKSLLEESKAQTTKLKHEEKTTQQKVVPPAVASSANADFNQKEEGGKFKPKMAKKDVLPVIVEPQLTPEQVKEGRLLHLKGINSHRDRAIQLLLWEIGFSYNVYAHQFDALLFVAGLNSKFPYSSKDASFLDEESSKGANARSKVLEQAANEFLDLESNKEPPNGSWLHILPTKGMLLADEMGLGKCSV